jgi:hypothetical protein
MAAFQLHGVRFAAAGALRVYILAQGRMAMISVSKCVYFAMLPVFVLGCEPDILNDDLTPQIYDSKYILSVTAKSAAVALGGFSEQITECTVTGPRPTFPDLVSFEFHSLSMTQPLDFWLPPNQPPLEDIPFAGTFHSVRNPKSFYSFEKFDVGGARQLAIDSGFEGEPLRVECGGVEINSFYRSSEINSVEELTRDGTTEEDMKRILTENGFTAPRVYSEALWDYQTATEEQ